MYIQYLIMVGTKCLATDDKTGISTNAGITLAFTVAHNTCTYLLSHYYKSYLTDAQRFRFTQGKSASLDADQFGSKTNTVLLFTTFSHL